MPEGDRHTSGEQATKPFASVLVALQAMDKAYDGLTEIVKDEGLCVDCRMDAAQARGATKMAQVILKQVAMFLSAYLASPEKVEEVIPNEDSVNQH